MISVDVLGAQKLIANHQDSTLLRQQQKEFATRVCLLYRASR